MLAGVVTVNVRRILTLVVLTLLIVGAGVIVALKVDLMPQQASTQAQLVDPLFRGLLGVATVIFLIVEGALVYAVLRFRRRPGDEADGPPVHGNNALELLWTAIPAVIVVVIAFASFRVLTASGARQPDPLIVQVIGRQFVWEFRYPEADVTAAELHLPLNRQVRFEISSDDVVHSFWVPEFRIKQDATPGQVAELLLTPTRAGRYPLRCAELCGAAHATMTGEVVVETAEEFSAWLTSQQAQAIIGGEPASVGRRLFSQYGCNACHTLTDAGAHGTVGPSLDGIGERAASAIQGLEARAYIEQSILEPDAHVVEGFPSGVMPPNFGERLTAEDLQALVDYLLSQ
jgi:cytochrome c oxidase subunit 2